jgi:hypothetical protein
MMTRNVVALLRAIPHKATIAFCLIMSLSSAVTAQIQSFRCNFSSAFNTNFDSGRPQSKIFVSDLGELLFDQLDPINKTGRLIGNAGATDVTILRGNRSIHIIEQTTTGNLNHTTIFEPTKESNNLYPVVHSRHLNLSAGPFPSQHLGLCRRIN